MKKYVCYSVLLMVVVIFASCGPTYVVRERPAEVVYMRPAPPSADDIWITGDWAWTGGRYLWHEGHYERRRPGSRWDEGHWINTHSGWRWMRGHWRRY
jgi:hypothetical protein